MNSPKPRRIQRVLVNALEPALDLVKQGFAVFPVSNRGKKPLTENGLNDASTCPDRMRAWFAKAPSYNLGIRTGDNGIFVLDVDDRHGGRKSLQELESIHGKLERTVRCRTGGGGEHIYLRCSTRAIGNRTGFRAGLDVRGKGGYVVAPPSVHESGTAYEWLEGCAPGEIPIAEAPDWLLDMVIQHAQTLANESTPGKPSGDLWQRARAYVSKVPGVGEGERNATAFRLAGHLRALGRGSDEPITDEWIAEHLRRWNATCTPPLSERELMRCVRNSGVHGTPRPTKNRKQAVKRSEPAACEGAGSDGRRRVVLWLGKQHEVVDECIRVLAAQWPPYVYQWHRSLVCITRPSDGEGPSALRCAAQVHPLSEAGLACVLNRRIEFVLPRKSKDSGEIEFTPTDCPLPLVKWILASGDWPGIPLLSGILRTPTMLRDGRLLADPGYDPQSGLYLDFEHGEYPEIPEQPTKAEAEAALGLLINTILEDFPFERPAHRSVVLSAMLSAVARPAVLAVPLHAFTAPVMASGKTLLAEVVSVIAQGRTAPAVSQGESEEEFEKRIHSVLMEGQRVAVIDNVRKTLGGDALCSAITGDMIGIRRFRTQEVAKVPTWGTVWIATGNNLSFDKDLRSRVIVCRIDPGSERPEQRTFTIPRLLEHVRCERAELVAALLTIVRGFVVAGKPGGGRKPLNRFEEWSDLIRGALIWIGEADPVETMDDISQADEETGSLAGLLHALLELHGYGKFRAVDVVGAADRSADLTQALDSICLSAGGNGHDSRRLGCFLKKSAGRVVDGLRLEVDSCAHGTNQYRVGVAPGMVRGGRGGSGGSGGTELSVSSRTRAHANLHEQQADELQPLHQVPPAPRRRRTKGAQGEVSGGKPVAPAEGDDTWGH